MVEPALNLDQFDILAPGQRPYGGCSSCGSGAAGDGDRCGNGLERVYPTTAVRFGYMRYIGEFSHPADLRFTCGAKVVIQTQRGIEIGSQVSLSCSGCDKSVTREEMRQWVRQSGEDTYMFNAGRILREATAADLAEFAHIQEGARERRDFARKTVERHGLPIRVVECECLFGGERIIFHFTAAERVDFRAMVKDLAKEYRTRIEMRQIGARDEARLLADYETCGREICCKVFLKSLKPISMRMAKLQKATLDPSQVSGRCGRLKCCLRYEHIGYEELDKRLPRNGARIQTVHGDGVVVNRQVLTQLVQIRTEDEGLVTVVVEDISDGTAKAPPPPRPEPESKEAPPRRPARRSSGRRGAAGRKTDARPSAPGKEPRREKQDDVSPKETPAPAAGKAPPESSEEQDGARRRRRRRRKRRRRGDGGGGGGASGSGGDGGSPPPSE